MDLRCERHTSSKDTPITCQQIHWLAHCIFGVVFVGAVQLVVPAVELAML